MAQPFWTHRRGPVPLSSDRLPFEILGRLARWAVEGTLAAVAFGVGLGLILGIPHGTIDIAIGGALFGLVGGPIFGLIAGLVRALHQFESPHRPIRIQPFAVVGALVFAIVPFIVRLARQRELFGPSEISEVVLSELFLLTVGAAFGAIVGLVGRHGQWTERGKNKS